MLTIEKAVHIARELVAEKGLRLGDIFSARLMDVENQWCVSFAIIKQENINILPDRVFVFVDNETGEGVIPTMI
ncbi:MAG TPA: hypothetical protein VG815_02950 [Chloroflexota bacterium]|nr:hypothetical protein [Chloroflexota bacterium]